MPGQGAYGRQPINVYFSLSPHLKSIKTYLQVRIRRKYIYDSWHEKKLQNNNSKQVNKVLEEPKGIPKSKFLKNWNKTQMNVFNKLLEITLERISKLVDWTEKIIQGAAQKAKTLKTKKEVIKSMEDEED